MTEEKNRPIRYLTRRDIADIHANLSAQVVRDGDEPLPEFRYCKQHEIDALTAAPQRRIFGRDAYPTLAEKAAIIFYTVLRRHIFPERNRRMATACLITFLLINGAELSVSPEQLTATVLRLAKFSRGRLSGGSQSALQGLVNDLLVGRL